jgi:hypothetical protein
VIEVDVFVEANEASIVTVAFALVELLESVNTDCDAPSGTVTFAGTGNTDGLLLLKVTVVPPAGALAFRATAAVTGPPPTIDEAISEMPPSIGTTPKVFDCVTPPEAKMTRKVFVFCGTVAMLKFACVAPAGIVMLAGTVATEALLLLKFTTVPPLGAGAGRIIVPVAGEGPTTN